MEKKLFLTTILTLLCCTLLLAAASAGYSGTPSKPDGNGTESDPYKISTAAELYWFAGLVNGDASIIDSVEKNTGAWAVLTDNITIQKIEWGSDGSLSNTPTYEWTPIGSGNNGYTGTFDGQGHTISGLYCSVEGGYAGLFGVVKSGTVQNVNIKDSYFKTTEYPSGSAAGGVCGFINSGNGKITNCSFSGSVSGKYAGGICGNSSGPITGCNNTGSVIGIGDNSCAGGVCAEISSNLCTIANCYNSGDVKSESSAGGVCGTNGSGEVKDCYNIGSVSGGGKVGGVCGSISSKWGTIKDCYNNGSVSGGGGYVGGVCGYNDEGTITSCYNNGSVRGSGDNSSVGGVCGYNLGGFSNSSPSSAVITNCYNIGIVSGGYGSNVGGVCGYNRKYERTYNPEKYEKYSAEITNCYNTGSVIGNGDNSSVGGVCGKNGDNNTGDNNKSIITNCLWLDTVADNGVGSNVGQVTVTNVESLTDAQFDAGEAAYLLNRAEGGGVWTVGEDGYPVLRPGKVNVMYKVTVDGVVYGASDEVFKLPAAPSKPGYIFLGWRTGDTTYQSGEVVMVSEGMSFTSVWANMPDIEPDEPDKLPFTDVDEGAWYYDAVYYVWENGIMEGVETDKFAPDSPLTRAMVWAVLARIDGVEVSGDSWMTVAQKWAVESGVSDGTNPTGYITREQLVTMLWRYKGSPVVEYTITAPDAASISDWALDAMKWAASTGLIEGDDLGNLNPTSNSTRAHAATFFMRFCKNK